jgi:hypothetical protein
VPVAEIPGERAGQQPIDRAGAAAQRFLRRADQNKSQALLDRLEVDAQIDGSTGGLSNDRRLRPTFEKQSSSVDGSVPTESKSDLASQLAGDIRLHALSRIRTEADSGDDGEVARLVLSDRECLGATPAEGGCQPGDESGPTNTGDGSPTRGRMRQGPGQGIELLRVHCILLLGLAALSVGYALGAQHGANN